MKVIVVCLTFYNPNLIFLRHIKHTVLESLFNSYRAEFIFPTKKKNYLHFLTFSALRWHMSLKLSLVKHPFILNSQHIDCGCLGVMLSIMFFLEVPVSATKGLKCWVLHKWAPFYRWHFQMCFKWSLLYSIWFHLHWSLFRGVQWRKSTLMRRKIAIVNPLI